MAACFAHAFTPFPRLWLLQENLVADKDTLAAIYDSPVLIREVEAALDHAGVKKPSGAPHLLLAYA
jgi:hypothetical protein